MTEQALKHQGDRLEIPELTRRARQRRLLWVVVLGAVAAAAAAYYTRPQPVRPLYRGERVARRTIVELVEATGSLDVRSQVDVPAPSEGRLTSIAVKPRDMVQKGQLLATLDQRAAELAVRSAKAGQQAAAGRLGQVQTAVDAARRSLERARQLKAKGLASEQDLAQAESDYASAHAAVGAAQADRSLAAENVAAAQLGQSMGAIVAPVSGIVLHAPERVGAAVSPARGPLFVIAEPLGTMRVEAPVSESEIARIAPGHKAEVIVQALPGRTFAASVDSIGIEPHRESGVVAYPVTLLVDNPDNVLLPGMSVRVRMEVARAQDALSVREAALRFVPPDSEPGASRSRVWRLSSTPNELEAVAVKPGISDGMYTAIEIAGDAAPAPSGGAASGARALHEGDETAIGLLRPEADSGKPSVSLGGK